MSVESTSGVGVVSEFVARTAISDTARSRAAIACIDTIGVMLAGACEPAARISQTFASDEGTGECRVLGTQITTSPGWAAFANGVAAHALDYDDMCFVSLAHPSCVLVPAILAAGEIAHASAQTLLDVYVVGFEFECRLGTVINPRHYHQRGWHCTSSIGTLGAAAVVARVLGLDAAATSHALGIAASSACGLKENMGSMVKPLHAGMAARNGLIAARLAVEGGEGDRITGLPSTSAAHSPLIRTILPCRITARVDRRGTRDWPSPISWLRAIASWPWARTMGRCTSNTSSVACSDALARRRRATSV